MLGEYLDWVRENASDLEGVGDFVALAAHLLLFKVRTLLPHREAEFDDPAGVDELLSVGQALEVDRQYRTFKDLASSLGVMESTVLQHYARGNPPVEFGDEDDMEVPLAELLRALTAVVRNIETSSYEVNLDEIDLTSKIEEIEKVLTSCRRVAFEELFAQDTSRIEVIVTFMAILELVKMRKAAVRQRRLFEKIWVYGRTADEGDRSDR